MKRKNKMSLLLLAILTSCTSSTEHSNTHQNTQESTTQNLVETVVDYSLDDERSYTGEMVNHVPHGQGILTWVKTNCVYTGEFKNGLYDGQGTFQWKNNGDSLVGTFANNCPVEGKFTYQNTMSYTGQFNDKWQFHGQGVFDWNTYKKDGSVANYGWLYEGEFKNGAMANCEGKVTFTVARDGSNGEGIYWYRGLMSGFPAVAVGQTGEGFIRFHDGSTYEGDLFVKSASEFIRLGQGIQDFTECTTLTAADFGASYDAKLVKYVGAFDGIAYGWIYGNGIVYFQDVNGNPKGYIKGFWNGTTRIKDWEGQWSEEYLLDGYRNTTEIEYKDVFERKLESFVHSYKEIDMSDKTLLLGTSWFEFWQTSYGDLYPTLDSVNFGIGGSGPMFWSQNINKLQGLKNAPKNIFYMPGGNDLASRGESIDDCVAKTKIVIEDLKKLFPTSHIYVCSFGPSPIRWYLIDSIMSGNQKLLPICEEEGVTYFDLTTCFFDKSNTTGKYYLEGYGSLMTDIWLSDNLHFNEKGYQLVTKVFIDYFSNV